MKLQVLIITLLLGISGTALAQDDSGTTLKVQNGVTVKAGPTPAPSVPTPVNNNKNTSNFDNGNSSVTPLLGSTQSVLDAKEPASGDHISSGLNLDDSIGNSLSQPDTDDNLADKHVDSITTKPADIKPVAKPTVTNDKPAKAAEPTPTPKIVTVGMKPIISPAPAKPAAKSSSPFKKSRDSGVAETIKKPDPKPDVKSESLAPQNNRREVEEDSMAQDITNLSAVKKPGSQGESGLPVPRFVSLKTGEVNARTGPGETYPVRWLYQRRNLPVEVTAEFKLWRRIKDFDGEQSWVHEATITGHRYGIISHDTSAHKDSDGGKTVAKFKRGVQVRLAECKKDSCHTQYGNIDGWVDKKDIWGAYASEVFN